MPQDHSSPALGSALHTIRFVDPRRLLARPADRSRAGLVLRAMSFAEAELRCPHVALMRPRMPRTGGGCERCTARRATWEELRLCSSCGHIGCCERSKHRHADRHFRETGHPVVEALGPEPAWWSCFVDQIRVFA